MDAGKQPNQPKPVEVKDSKGVVIGDFAHVVNNFFQGVDEKVFKRFGLEQRFGFLLLGVLVILVGAGLYFALKPKLPETMSGDFRIAVAGFAELGKMPQANLGYELADGLRLRFEKDLQQINPGLVISIWGPDRAGGIRGDTPVQRAEQAEQLARKIHADMVIYGAAVDAAQGSMQVLPEFYISAENFYEGREITGQNDLGEPFSLPGQVNAAWRFEFGKSMFTRSKVLATLSVGLAYFALHDYAESLTVFQSAESIPDWPDNQGKKVLYTLIGLAAGKKGSYATAEDALRRAIQIDPAYARPYIGLANVSYMHAIQGYETSKNAQDIQPAFLQDCFSNLDRASQAQNKPPLADVDTKIHFSRGQCALALVYSGQNTDLKPAFDEFSQVVQDYQDGQNPRIRELAAEAHARIGLIYNLTEKVAEAAQQYQLAADLLADFPDRQAQYLKRAGELKAKASTP